MLNRHLLAADPRARRSCSGISYSAKSTAPRERQEKGNTKSSTQTGGEGNALHVKCCCLWTGCSNLVHPKTARLTSRPLVSTSGRLELGIRFRIIRFRFTCKHAPSPPPQPPHHQGSGAEGGEGGRSKLRPGLLMLACATSMNHVIPPQHTILPPPRPPSLISSTSTIVSSGQIVASPAGSWCLCMVGVLVACRDQFFQLAQLKHVIAAMVVMFADDDSCCVCCAGWAFALPPHVAPAGKRRAMSADERPAGKT